MDADQAYSDSYDDLSEAKKELLKKIDRLEDQQMELCGLFDKLTDRVVEIEKHLQKQ